LNRGAASLSKGTVLLFTLYQTKGVLSIPDSEAKKKWDKENTVFVGIKLFKATDTDILQKLENVPNRQGYIKSVIRKDIAEEKSE